MSQQKKSEPAKPTTPDQAKPEQPPAAPEASRAQAGQARRDAYEGVKDSDRGMVDALLAERRGYVQRGMKDRAAAVDEQLRHRGYRTA